MNHCEWNWLRWWRGTGPAVPEQGVHRCWTKGLFAGAVSGEREVWDLREFAEKGKRDMSCEKMETRILGYADGRLKESERLDAEKHLAVCATCRLRVNEFRAVGSLLSELPMIMPSEGFDARVRALVAAEPVKQSWWARLNFSPRVAFAASMLLLATLWMGFYSRTAAPPAINGPEADAQLMQDLPVLEDHDVLQNFEPLKSLPDAVQDDDSNNTQQQM